MQGITVPPMPYSSSRNTCLLDILPGDRTNVYLFVGMLLSIFTRLGEMSGQKQEGF